MPKRNPSAKQPALPFGSDPQRSLMPLVILSVLYTGWFAFLLWAAIERATTS